MKLVSLSIEKLEERIAPGGVAVCGGGSHASHPTHPTHPTHPSHPSKECHTKESKACHTK